MITKGKMTRGKFIQLLSIGAAGITLAACASAVTQPPKETQQENLRAVDGETVWVLLNHVKPDRRKEFERFMHEIIGKIGAQSESHVLNRTRILHPTEPNKDGSYTYIFLMDPVMPDGEYSFEKLLPLAYSPEEVKKLLPLFYDSLVSDQVGYVVTQTAW
jgi:hypothetical protein